VQSGFLNALTSYRIFYKFSVFYLAIFRGLKLNQEKETEKEKKEKEKKGPADRTERPGSAKPDAHARSSAAAQQAANQPAQQLPPLSLFLLFSFFFLTAGARRSGRLLQQVETCTIAASKPDTNSTDLADFCCDLPRNFPYKYPLTPEAFPPKKFHETLSPSWIPISQPPPLL
jgi:hypothetical protein